MEKIKEYINNEIENIPVEDTPNKNNSNIKINIKKNDPISKLKEDFEIWIENLNRSIHLRKYRQVLSEIECGKGNFDSIPEEHWRYKIIQLKAIFNIIKRKLKKYAFEITKETSQQNHSVLFWFNQSYILLEQLILEFRDDINIIDLKTKEILKPIQYVFLGYIEFLYLLINYSYINGEIQNICAYLSMVDRLSNYSGYIVNINTLPLLQKIYLFRVKICLANCDFINGIKYVKKTIDLCTDQLMYIIDYDLNLDNLEKYEQEKNNPFKINKMNKKIIEEIFVNIALAFYLRGVLSELLGNVTNAIDSYKQSKFFTTKFLKNKYYNFTMFFNALQNNGYIYLAVMDEFKELKEKKEAQSKIRQKLLEKKKYFDKIKYQKNYNKFYSNINTQQDLYKGELKHFLDYAGDILYKEEQNRHSILKKFTKTTYITSTMKMINNLLSKDFKNVLKQIKKVEVTKPSIEVNSLINRALIKKRQKLFNKNDEKKIKFKKNFFNKRTQSTNYNTYGDITKTINSTKNRKINFKNKNIYNIHHMINSIEQNSPSKQNYNLKPRPFSVGSNKTKLYYRLKNRYEKLKKSRINSASSMKVVKNKMNKSEQSSLDTLDNEYSNKGNYFMDNNNSLCIAKNSFYIKSNSIINSKRKNKRCNSSYFYSFFDKNFSLNKNRNKKNKSNEKNLSPKNYKKINIKPKKEFRIDKDNFGIDYLNKKIFLDKYCNEEIKFHRKLLKSKSCELECTKEPTEFDLKKSRRDAELTFNKIYELCKSSSNKKNIHNYLKQRNLSNTGMSGTMTTSSDFNKKVLYSLYQVFKEDKKEDKVLDVIEKKHILFNNEEKIEMLNMEYEQMIQKENEIKNKKKKLLEEIMRK